MSNFKVLLVDDEESFLEQAELFIESIDDSLHLVTASSTEEALDILDEEDELDAVVSDYQMPGIDGLQFLEKVRNERGRDIPFIMFTGKGREEVAMKSLNLGADRYLRKGGDPKSQYAVLVDAIIQEINHFYAKKNLRESEERYRRLFETAQDGMLILDAKTGKIKDANPYLQNLIGYKKDELIGKELWEIGTFQSVIENKERFNELVEEGFIRYEDLPLRTKEGEEAPVEFVSNTYEAGEELVVQCNIRDISKRKQAEKALDHLVSSVSESAGMNLFESIVKELSDWFDVDGVCVGKVLDDGKTVSALSMILDDGWIEDYEYTLDGTPCQNVLDKGACLYEKNICSLYPDDEELQELGMEGYLGIPIKKDNQPIGVIWAVSRSEITEVPPNWERLLQVVSDRAAIEMERMERENELKKLHEIASKLEILDSEEEICRTAVNAAENILKFSICSIDLVDERGKLAVKAVSEDVSDDDYMEGIKPEEAGIAGKTFLNNESYILDDVQEHGDSKPQNERYKSAISVPIKNKGVFQAISSEKGYFDENDIEMAELLMTHVSEALDRVYANEREEFLHSLLRHDVKNKSQIVQGYLQLLRDLDLPEEAEEYIRKAKKATVEGIDIIEKVRKLRKIKQKEEVEEVDVSSVINKILSEHKHQLEENGVDIEIQKIDCVVKGGALLEELFSNLVENSIKHSDCDKISIQAEAQGDECVVIVEDDGKGIPKEVKSKVFEKGFKDGENAGSGLGLSMVKEIAENYGGSIDVGDSEMGGARFDVRLKKI